MTAKIEKMVLSSLVNDDEYSRKVAPFLKEEYFADPAEKVVFKRTYDFILEYNSRPTKEAIEITLSGDEKLHQKLFTDATELVSEIFEMKTDQDQSWLFKETENFCQNKSIYNAIMESIKIYDGNSDKTTSSLPSLLSDALSVSFDTHIGHDYIEDADDRFDFYHKVETKIPFDLDFFNSITQGGTPQKTLNIVIAGTGVGKSMFLCHHAANCLVQNKNVLYITCEMAEERIAERIDANLMDISMDDLKALPKQIYDKKIERVSSGVTGKLIVKEYPTASANSNHFRSLLDELEIKKKFVPDIIFIDYLNICASSRYKQNGNVNSYMYIKSIAEELRGLAVERNVPIFSATQTNREGFSNTDVSLENTSESFGLPATADFMFALISTEELEDAGQIMIKQLKNRYNDTAVNRKFILGLDRGKMKFYDVDINESIELSGANTKDTDDFGSGFGYSDKFQGNKEKFSEWNL